MSSQSGQFSQAELRKLAQRGAAELDGANATDLLRWTEQHFGAGDSPQEAASCNYVIAANMQDAVLIHLAAAVHPGVPVIFLDTGYHFAETLGTRDAVEATYDIRILNITPEHTVSEQDQLLGKDLFASDPHQCCQLRKVIPLTTALRGYGAWVTGIRRVEASTRANAPLISFDEQFQLVKINPLAAWTDQDMQDYITQHNILVNPLVQEGYPSVGCAPCTAKPAEGADPRSGRWQGQSKIECGLHAS